MQQNQHHHFMSLALELAARGRKTVSPNPMVGCVVARDNQIVGEGYHQYAGGPHAEINAIDAAQEKARGATAYVTLEPCAHHGRTPPCTDALIAAGITKIFVACLDPNPLVNGSGVELLQNAGIEVEVGLCESEAIKLNEIFFHYITHHTPFVFAKWAMSLDGKTITHKNDNRYISGPEANKFTHQLRSEVDAIIIGANTARSDDPLLTVRLSNDNNELKQPLRIILSADGNLPDDLKIFSNELLGKIIIATTAAPNMISTTIINKKNVEVLVLPKNRQGLVDLPSLLAELGKRGISSVLVEGGMTIHESFIQENLIQKIFVYVSPVIIGALEKKQPVTVLQTKQLMNDFIYEVKYV